jgi:hypothetical protein
MPVFVFGQPIVVCRLTIIVADTAGVENAFGPETILASGS